MPNTIMLDNSISLLHLFCMLKVDKPMMVLCSVFSGPDLKSGAHNEDFGYEMATAVREFSCYIYFMC